MRIELKEKISELISSKREGNYWDFKELHHTNKASLLHDILAMANSVSKSNKYIIYGISDPSSGCEIKGFSYSPRRTQTNIIDFLRSKHFAGDNRPEIELKTIEIKNKQIDVLIIFDHPNKPYYIVNDYKDNKKCVRANYIYTRNLDANTPIDKSANIWLIERMWREKFGLDLQPAKRIIKLLDNREEWDIDIGNKDFSYHKFHPEFQIKFSEPKEFKDVYSYFYINPSSYIGTAYFLYFNTVLFSLPYILCDEMRVQLATPSNGCIRIEGRDIRYQYYIIESKQGAFHKFIYNGEIGKSFENDMTAYVFYKNKHEKNIFERYISNNIEKLDAINDSKWANVIQEKINKCEDSFLFKPVEMKKVVELFDCWRKNNLK